MPSAGVIGDADIEHVACQRVVPALLAQGFCWLDGVMGDVIGGAVLEEVRRMHLSGVLKGGRLVRSDPGLSQKAVRGDRIAWVTGAEGGCEGVAKVLTAIDKLVTAAATHLHKSISHRTKAMVACYPGNGAGYVKHVDNPNSDGRCLTCIYYLNKDWSAQEDGGLLRIYPDGKPYVVDIEPVFDRLLLFWSDRRNPHEVLPSYSSRFAIAVWYFDSAERSEAKRRCRKRTASENRDSSSD